MAERTGQCLCGSIKYSLSGPAATPLYNTVCYCLNCRRATGSALYTALICLKDGFKVIEGDAHQKAYSDTATDSGQPLKRVFCDTCGTMLFAYTPLWDEIVSVAAGSLDDFDSWKPDTEQYCVHRADWLVKIKDVAKERTFKLAVKGDTE